MCVLVVTIPYRSVSRCGIVLEAIDHKLDRSSSIGNKDQVEFVRVGVEEAKRSFSY